MQIVEQFSFAVANGYTKTVRAMLIYVDPSADNNDAIQTASENGYTKIVRILLTHPNVDPSTNNNYRRAKMDIRRSYGCYWRGSEYI